jgi:hypothetical protein
LTWFGPTGSRERQDFTLVTLGGSGGRCAACGDLPRFLMTSGAASGGYLASCLAPTGVVMLGGPLPVLGSAQ